MILLAIATTPAAAVEQNCRFVQAQGRARSLLQRQEEALAATAQAGPPADDGQTLEYAAREPAGRRGHVSQHQQYLPRLLSGLASAVQYRGAASRRTTPALPPPPRLCRFAECEMNEPRVGGIVHRHAAERALQREPLGLGHRLRRRWPAIAPTTFAPAAFEIRERHDLVHETDAAGVLRRRSARRSARSGGPAARQRHRRAAG